MASLTITRRAADRLRAGHLWVYRSDLVDASEAAALGAGALVTIADQRQIPLGSALYSSTSQIAARMVSRTPQLTREEYLNDVRERLAAALQLRRELTPRDAATDAQRLVFAEADNLPGIVLDLYNDLAILQLLMQGTAQDDVRNAVTDVLREYAAAQPGAHKLTVWERPDPRIRQMEQLAPSPTEALYSTEAEPPAATDFLLNGLRFHYAAAAGQKTGAFLDQRLNYAAAAAQVAASGRAVRALDVCTYHGGFALHLARVCERVTGIDQSHAALETAESNLGLNGALKAQVDWVEADAFEMLRALDDASRPGASSVDLPIAAGSFDAIVLDPPAFAKSKRAVDGALRGYKEMNLRALRLLAPGGTLVTCSCSHHVSLEQFTGMLQAAAADAGRRVQLLETRAAAPDHPEVLTLPETRYLKCLIARVD
jgi:23S rRNA (cytosine1962-C5)-methyltransferase